LSIINSNTLLVKSIAKDLGFMSCGISKSGFLEDEAKIVNGKKEFNSTIEKKIHKDSFKKIKSIMDRKFPELKINFKILSLKD